MPLDILEVHFDLGKKRTASPLNLWVDFAKTRRELMQRRVYCEKLKNTFIKTLGEEDGTPSEGMSFTKKAANEFTKYVKTALKDQSAFEYTGVPGLDESLEEFGVQVEGDEVDVSSAAPLTWTYRQKKRRAADKGIIPSENIDKIGLATEQMYNAIRPLDMGRGTWRVGIHPGDVVETRFGNFEQIWKYAEILEKGREGQKARPWLLPTFYKWVDEELPEYVKEDIGKPIFDLLSKLDTKKETVYSGEEYKGDLISSADVEEEVKEVITETTKQGKGFDLEAPYQAEEPIPKEKGKVKIIPREKVWGEYIDESVGGWTGFVGPSNDFTQVVWNAKVVEGWIDYLDYLEVLGGNKEV